MLSLIKNATFSSHASRVIDVFIKNLTILFLREYLTKINITNKFMYINYSNNVEIILIRVKRALLKTRY